MKLKTFKQEKTYFCIILKVFNHVKLYLFIRLKAFKQAKKYLDMKLKARGSKPHATRELMGRCEGWTHGVAKRAGTKKAPAGRRGNASAGAKALRKR